MKLNIKLYGTLSRSLDSYSYDHSSGLDLTLPEDSCVNDLLLHLNIVQERVGMVVMDGKPVQEDTPLKNQAHIKVFQPIAGG